MSSHPSPGTVSHPSTDSPPASRWQRLADRVLEGGKLSADEAAEVLAAPDAEILDLLHAAFRVRQHYFGRKVQLYLLMNAKSGLCPEDCSYCSQSKVATSEIPRYNLLNRDELLSGAEAAVQRQASTYCIVISARGPNEREMAAVEQIVPEIKQRFPLNVCACLGLLTPEQAARLKACGVDRVNHNLTTGGDFYGEICSTHTYQDRLDTLHAVRDAGLELCSGGIIGMGEEPRHVVDMALELRELGVHSIPVNFLNPIEGTPLAGRNELRPTYCLKVLAMFAANSIFVGDYLTTKGQLPEADYAMIRDLGFEVVEWGEAAAVTDC